MKEARKARVIIYCSVVITVLMWVWYKSIHPISPENYSAISGVLESKEEVIINKSVRLSFYIKNNPISFQIPAYLYEKSVNRELLFKTVHQGDLIYFLADKHQLNKSINRSPDLVKPITAYSFRYEDTIFLTLEAQNKIIKDQKISILISTWMMTIFSVFLSALYFKVIPNDLFKVNED